MNKITNLLFTFLIHFSCFGQADLYDVNTLQEIKIYFSQNDWDQKLDELYVSGEGERLLCTVEINGERFDEVGIRYKGFSSVSTNRDKNPFNIKLDHTYDLKYQSYTKIKLGNVIQDPSFIREVLSYDIAKKYMPSAKANYAKVYINDEYWGLYTNVESIEENFLKDHFGSSQNTFVKCNPEDLDLNGENSNLNNSHGENPDNYLPFYDVRSDTGIEDLYDLIFTLNENPDELEHVLNIDRTLWMHALNYALVNFDSYIGYAQNYYLYQKSNGQFQPILWDMNQSFGSYRLTDASEHFDGFSIEQAKTIDPLLHHTSVSVSPRPLLRKLFKDDTNRKIFLAHLRTIIEENFSNNNYVERANTFRALIEQAVSEDTNKFYGFDDFQNNLSETVSDLVEYPGITDLMEARSEYLLNYEGIANAPVISDVLAEQESNGLHYFTASVSNADQVVLKYRSSSSDNFQTIIMKDDGTQNDGAAGDGIYGCSLTFGNNLQYYFLAENETSAKLSPERAAYEFYTISYSNVSVGELVINEFMASNSLTITDEEGKYEDWIELHNTTDAPISLAGLFLTDDPVNIRKWECPDVNVPANGYLLIWADEDGSDGELHANFKLSASGESIHLSYADSTIVDEITFGEQTSDVATGRIPNGTGPFIEVYPTPNARNSLTSVFNVLEDLDVTTFPNPADEFIFFNLDEQESMQIRLLDLNGRLIMEQAFDKTAQGILDLKNVPDGFYILNFHTDSAIGSKKIIIDHD